MEVHRRAGTGRDDHREIAGEDIGGVTGHFAGSVPITGIESGLTAAGLVFGKLDGDAEIFENLHCGFCRLIVEGVAKAGSHQHNPFAKGSFVGCNHIVANYK